ncbi:hypothetical protein EDD36DRAFT_419180 [Exophiala viscosa]|uniref:Transcription factor domain-containing protein n=1 Tax=Exophiala viscosa TaxID=2486360 RepID=A0AAN6DY49_9EURO|nr:hypothetical protein EDD36DRAFT_419180 [Exophiala viscosa]
MLPELHQKTNSQRDVSAISTPTAIPEQTDEESIPTPIPIVEDCDDVVSQRSSSIDRLESDASLDFSSSISLSDSGRREHGGSASLIRSPHSTPLVEGLSSGSVPLFDFMRRVFVPHLVRPASDPRFIEGYTSQSLQLAWNVPFLMHALMACSGVEFPGDTGSNRKMSESYYTKALGGFREHLAQDHSQQSEAIALRTIFILIIYEVSVLNLIPQRHRADHDYTPQKMSILT